MPRNRDGDDRYFIRRSRTVTLEDLVSAKELALTRCQLKDSLQISEGRYSPQGQLFGVPLDDGLKEAIRATLRATLRERLIACETALQDLGIIIPDAIEPRRWDPLAGVVPEPAPAPSPGAPGHASIAPSSWDPATGEFTVRIPCAPARAQRYVAGAWVEVDESLNPHGLVVPLGAPVYDVTNTSAMTMGQTVCGFVMGMKENDEGVDLRVRIEEGHCRLREGIASGRIAHVAIGYDVRQETVVKAQGIVSRPLVNVHAWKLTEIRLIRYTDLSANPVQP